MDIYEYVENKWGSSAEKNLHNIRQGGDNNEKGSEYEKSYAVYKFCSIAAHNINLDDHVISAQDVAFVDDLCVRVGSNELKTNYQAKNSSGAAADFTSEMCERFIKQSIIDKEHFGFENSKQVLLVSCEIKAVENRISIPKEREFECEYFPYFVGSTALILGFENLRRSLTIICRSENPSLFDSAYRILLGVWSSEQAAISVADLFRKARGICRPNLFAGLEPEATVPDWLKGLCDRFPKVSVRVESGRYVVGCSGLDVSLGADVVAPTPEELADVSTLGQLIDFLIGRATTELKN
jgi:hypothetical protein